MYKNNGTVWSTISLGLPGGVNSGYLYSIWGSGTNDVYAVGSGNNDAVPLVYHSSNGTTWSATRLNLPAGVNSGYLYSIWGSGANDVYAVGYGNDGTIPLLYHKAGGAWIESSPSHPFLPDGVGSGNFKGVWGSGASNVFIVGGGNNGTADVPLVYHNNCIAWSAISLGLPNGVTSGYLNGIWGSGASDLYAVGAGNEGTVPLMYRSSNGTDWTEASPAPPSGWSSDLLYGVWGSGTSDVYAVGVGNNTQAFKPLLYHSSQTGQDVTAPGGVVNLSATAGATNGSVKLSWQAPADDDGGPVASYLVKYSLSSFTGWSDGIPVTTGLPTPANPGAAQTMTVSNLKPATQYYFAIRAQDEQYNLGDPVMVSARSASIYDDTDPAWVYTGSWTAYNGSLAFANHTTHYTTAVGNIASFTFTGTQFILTYTQSTDRGNIEVFVDGSKVATIRAKGSLAFQQTYTSPI